MKEIMGSSRKKNKHEHFVNGSKNPKKQTAGKRKVEKIATEIAK